VANSEDSETTESETIEQSIIFLQIQKKKNPIRMNISALHILPCFPLSPPLPLFLVCISGCNNILHILSSRAAPVDVVWPN
jgi:hypothetical protein